MNEFIKGIEAMSAERKQICMKCEHLRPRIKQCAKCGCWLPGKTRIPTARCPVGKWPKRG